MLNTSTTTPITIQQKLFSFLTGEQQVVMKKYLWPLKREAQEYLCRSLIDYIVYGDASTIPTNGCLDILFCILTGYDMPDNYKPLIWLIPGTVEDPRKGIHPNEDFDREQ